jgi:hypothetical protein
MGERHRYRKFDPEEGVLCHYCSIVLTRKNHSVDHVVPQSLGGKDERYNRVPSCIPCNVAKSDTWPNPLICNCRFCRKSVKIHREGHNVTKPKVA